MGQSEAAKGHKWSVEGARAYRGRPGASPASEMAPCVENSKLHTLLHNHIKQHKHLNTLTDTIRVRARQRGVVKGRSTAPARTGGGPARAPRAKWRRASKIAKLHTILHSQIKQQWRMSTLADTIWVRTKQPRVTKGQTRAPARTGGGPRERHDTVRRI